MKRRVATTVILLALIIGGCAPRLQMSGLESSAPSLDLNGDKAVFTMRDGARLPARVWRPDGEIKAVVLALHGFNIYSRIFEEPARAWADRGILTIAYDQRGFGETGQRGLWPGVDVLTEDLIAASEVTASTFPGVPLSILGDSMGGAAVLAALDGSVRLRGDRFVLVAPAVWGRAAMPAWQTAGLWLFAHTLPWLEVTGQNLNRVPTDNIELLRQLGRDPLVIKRTRIDAIWGLVNLMDAARAGVAAIDRPALIQFGAKEDILPEDAWRGALMALPDRTDWRLKVYEAGFHMLLSDLEARPVIDDIANFVLADPSQIVGKNEP